jgi:drug/metabolite transporter (DMT)-like permease
VILLPAAGAFAGVMLVLRFRPGAASWHAAVGPWEVAGLASAVLAGAAVAAIRAARRSEGSWSIFASFTLFGVLCTLPLGVTRWVTPTVSEWVWLALVGLTSLAAQLLMTWAFRWVDNLQAGVIAQLSVVVSMALGVGFLDDRLAPLQALGALLTIASVVVVIALGAPAVPSPSGTRRGPEPRGREA